MTEPRGPRNGFSGFPRPGGSQVPCSLRSAIFELKYFREWSQRPRCPGTGRAGQLGAGRAGGGGGRGAGVAAGMARRRRAPGEPGSEVATRDEARRPSWRGKAGSSEVPQQRAGAGAPSALAPAARPAPRPATATGNVSGGAGLSNRAQPQPPSQRWLGCARSAWPRRPGGAGL